MTDLTQRYSRQLILKNWNLEKQRRLSQLSVSVPSQLPATALYLAAAGIGRLVFNDQTNLSSHIKKLNPNVEVVSGELVSGEVDIKIELAGETTQSAHLETSNGSPIKIVVFHSGADKLYASAMASSKVISLVHFGEI